MKEIEKAVIKSTRKAIKTKETHTNNQSIENQLNQHDEAVHENV